VGVNNRNHRYPELGHQVQDLDEGCVHGRGVNAVIGAEAQVLYRLLEECWLLGHLSKRENVNLSSLACTRSPLHWWTGIAGF